ncbi:MAG: sugar phosphate isomerase/epimerase [Clostridia bacterium]|nr:sugar phosphate isomerase/epimerase [Clostridia bacterium]
MKKSINAWSFPVEYSFEECLAAAKKAGFHAIEFNLDKENKGHSFTTSTTDDEILAVKALCEQYEILPVSISSSLHHGIWSKTAPEDKEYAVGILKAQLNVAKLMGADTILLVPGGMKDGISLKDARENSLCNLKAVEGLIRESGVTVGLENVWNGFFLSPYDMLSFLDDLGSDVFALYFDLGNMVAFSTSEYWAEIVGSKAAKIHIKDFKRNGGINSGGVFCDLLKGDLDFKAAMKAMKGQGFDGYLTAEVGKGKDVSWEEFFRSVSDAEETIIGYYNEA